jgi:hypothetical protein
MRTTEVSQYPTSSTVNCVLPSHPGRRCLRIDFSTPRSRHPRCQPAISVCLQVCTASAHDARNMHHRGRCSRGCRPCRVPCAPGAQLSQGRLSWG